ncbi:MAG: hypothetical protein GY754_10135 [bacterium]|nr:hypothetical protein [bacterium]
MSQTTQQMLDSIKNEKEIILGLGKIERATLKRITKELIENLSREPGPAHEVYSTSPEQFRVSLAGFEMAALQMIHAKVCAEDSGECVD